MNHYLVFEATAELIFHSAELNAVYDQAKSFVMFSYLPTPKNFQSAFSCLRMAFNT
jgi:hypothetical protein